MKPIGALDFETMPIKPRPAYPPVPVGVALRGTGDHKGRYLAWGHPTGNNCTKTEAIKQVKAFARAHTLLCHHAGFDLDVLEVGLGLPWPSDHEDTLLLAFLEDPDSDSLSLKPLAERYLSEPPTEMDALHQYILDMAKAGHKDFQGATKKTAGAYIAFCPGNLVAPYAIGDVDRTVKLYRHFKTSVLSDARFRGAYAREKKCTHSLVKMERRGVPIATEQLRKDVKRYEGILAAIEEPLLAKLKVKKADREEFKWVGKNFALQLFKSKVVKELPQTDKGNDSTAADALIQVMPPKLAKEFEVRSQVANCLGTFMRPWLIQAENNGHFFARFNQVRNGDEWGKKTGARTGRLSMKPNLQNVIRSDKDPRVPILRDYLIAGKSYGWLAQRDYSQQELRILAHFEEGPFLQSYLEHPDQDAHEAIKGLILQITSIDLPRRAVKDLNFGLIYGQGIALTAEKMGLPLDEAKRARSAHASSLPGIPALQKKLRARAAANEPVWTWGGRRYYCEKPAFIAGRFRTFEYKMLNRLIQPSAADCTKQAMVNYDALGDIAEENPMLLQVHDELILGVKGRSLAAAKRVHEALRDAMADVAFSVPMTSDGKLGKTSWHRMEKVEW